MEWNTFTNTVGENQIRQDYWSKKTKTKKNSTHGDTCVWEAITWHHRVALPASATSARLWRPSVASSGVSAWDPCCLCLRQREGGRENQPEHEAFSHLNASKRKRTPSNSIPIATDSHFSASKRKLIQSNSIPIATDFVWCFVRCCLLLCYLLSRANSIPDVSLYWHKALNLNTDHFLINQITMSHFVIH